jgi:hypothetical protein
MESAEVTRLYGGAILSAMDHLQADAQVDPKLEAKICLAIHAAVEEAFRHTSHGQHVAEFLGGLGERVHACLSCADAHLRQTALAPIMWDSEGDE